MSDPERMTIRITIDVEYEVEDETELRAATAAEAGPSWNPGDAVMQLLNIDLHRRLAIPGTRMRVVSKIRHGTPMNG
jgi:hypothetical protein